ncbi:ATP-grasp fold amidoligase family protein [Isoptericola sp. NPDC056573]|uniref:ATP-grasp fold amidoligase family protein n=1 Tax=Isoptericola sp. NPDC056573 TaxID=3345868 RepID=UPI003696AA0E
MPSPRAAVARAFAGLPPVARRDAEIRRLSGVVRKRARALRKQRERVADLQAEVAGLRAQVRREREKAVAHDTTSRERLAALRSAKRRISRGAEPTFSALLAQQRSLYGRLRDTGGHAHHPMARTEYKLHNVAFARSHGVPTAPVFQAWGTIDEIDLGSLPDEFVLKADGGASARGVFPIRRTGGSLVRIDTGERVSCDDIKDRLRAFGDRIRGPYFAEALLPSSGESPVPDDIKVYTFYGQPAQVLLMRPAGPRRRDAGRRYIDPVTGADLGEVLPGVTYRPDIPVPDRLPEILAAARHLSLATGADFGRFDFYDTPHGIRFGEITPAPGDPQQYHLDHDLALGSAWLDARVRVLQDEAAGRPRGLVWGAHPSAWLYPAGSEPDGMESWPRTVPGCDRWCVPSSPRAVASPV